MCCVREVRKQHPACIVTLEGRLQQRRERVDGADAAAEGRVQVWYVRVMYKRKARACDLRAPPQAHSRGAFVCTLRGTLFTPPHLIHTNFP